MTGPATARSRETRRTRISCRVLCVAAAFTLSGLAARCWALDPTKAIGQYVKESWTTVQGLPQGSILAIAQARDGHLWFGTRTGLARFDGQTFTLFHPSNSPGLVGRTVQSLQAAADGSLWIGTDGKGITQYRDGVFRTIGSESGLAGESGNSFYVDEKGVLWIATWMGVVAFDGVRPTRTDAQAGLPHNSVFAVTGDRKGTVWAATALGLAEFHQGRLTRVRPELNVLEPQCLLFDSRGILWIGAASGLHRYDGKRTTHLTASDGLLANFVTALAEDRDGNVWIGTEGGLNRWANGRLDAYSADDGLPGSAVASVMEDREGSLWVGLRGAGLVRFQTGALTTYTRREGLADDNVTSVFQSSDGSLWFGTTHGLTRLQDGRFTSYGKREGLLNESITGLGEHPDFGVLIATYAKQLNVFRGGRIGVLPLLTIASSVPSVIHTDRQRALWVGTLGVGLYRVAGGRAEHFPFADTAGRHVIRAVHEDPSGVLWFATANGLIRLERGRFSAVEVFRQEPNLGVTFGLHADGFGNLWVATRDAGVCRMREGKTVRCYGRAEGLLDETVYQLLEDGTGRLFMSTPRGIGVVTRKELDAIDRGELRRVHVLRLGVEDGMMTAECQGTRWPAGFKDTEGRFWFPTARGVVVADPRRLGPERRPPPVSIEAVTVNGRSFPLSQSIAVPPGRGDIDIAYASLSFRAPGLIRFRYRLAGFSPDWVEAGARRTAHFTNIPPGTYRFQVTAAEEAGDWNDASPSVELALAPHFYETRTWYAFVALCALCLVWPVYRWRLRSLRVRAAELSRKVAEALASAKVLRGLLPICASCKRIRSDKGYWEQIEAYIRSHSEADFTHGLCPTCVRLLYPDIADRVLARTQGGVPRSS